MYVNREFETELVIVQESGENIIMVSSLMQYNINAEIL